MEVSASDVEAALSEALSEEMVEKSKSQPSVMTLAAKVLTRGCEIIKLSPPFQLVEIPDH